MVNTPLHHTHTTQWSKTISQVLETNFLDPSLHLKKGSVLKSNAQPSQVDDSYLKVHKPSFDTE